MSYTSYSPQDKLKLLAEAQQVGDSEVSRRRGVSRRSLKRWRDEGNTVTSTKVVVVSQSIRDQKEPVLIAINEGIQYLKDAIAFHRERGVYDPKEILAITNSLKLLVEIAVLLE